MVFKRPHSWPQRLARTLPYDWALMICNRDTLGSVSDVCAQGSDSFEWAKKDPWVIEYLDSVSWWTRRHCRRNSIFSSSSRIWAYQSRTPRVVRIFLISLIDTRTCIKASHIDCSNSLMLSARFLHTKSC